MRAAPTRAALAAALLLAGCAVAPRTQVAGVAAPAWMQAPELWRIRQIVLVERGEAKLPLQGMLELDTDARTVRLAALDDFGVTLFKLAVTPDGERVDYLLPVLPRGAEITSAVALSLRRIYLAPGAAAPGGGEVVLEAGPDGRVATARPRGGGRWQVWYDDYRDEDGVEVPRQIRYREKDGAALTITQESVRRVER